MMSLQELIQTAKDMLIGEEFKDFCYYGIDFDPEWWRFRMWISRN